MSNSPVIDSDAIANLRSLCPDDDDAFLKEIVAIFAEDTPKRLEELATSLALLDATTFIRAAHSIKGSAANVGAHVLRDVASQIELRARKEGLQEAGADVPAAVAAFESARQELLKITQG